MPHHEQEHPRAFAEDAARALARLGVDAGAIAPILGEFSSGVSPLPLGHILGEDLVDPMGQDGLGSAAQNATKKDECRSPFEGTDATATAKQAPGTSPLLGRITRARACALQEELKAGLMTQGAPGKDNGGLVCLLVATERANVGPSAYAGPSLA